MLKVHRFRLKVLSPLHIGGRFQSIFPFEYIIDGDRLIVVREDKLGKFLEQKGVLSDFIRGFEQPGFSLTQYLKNKNLLTPQLLKEVALYSCKLEGTSPIGKSIRPFTRDAFQRPYVPGTAIKGAMRTALWYYKVKSDPATWESKVREAVRKKGIAKIVDDELDKEIFQNYRLNDKNNSPYTDILRVIKVSDSKPWERDSLWIGEELTFADGNIRKDLSVFLEYQKEAVETQIEIVFDEELFERFKKAGKVLFDSFEDFLVKVDGFYREVARMEQKQVGGGGKGYYEWLLNKTEGRGYLMRIGWGGGLPSLTIWLALSNDLREEIRIKFFKRSHKGKFPMTRRALRRREKDKVIVTPFGWVLLEKEVNDE
ncbi:type III-A CRISPR-associated RAMP protein Csm5 [bacterium]|nr:type III-A CRISPR-associated RAMP protein Csm5 [bacterium]